jgi:hypothetical protein
MQSRVLGSLIRVAEVLVEIKQVGISFYLHPPIIS